MPEAPAEDRSNAIEDLDARELLAVARGDVDVRSMPVFLWDVLSPLLLLASGALLLWIWVVGTDVGRLGLVLGIFLIAYGVSSWVENDALENRLDALAELLERQGVLEPDADASDAAEATPENLP